MQTSTMNLRTNQFTPSQTSAKTSPPANRRRRRNARPGSRHRRSAFTLLELLLVLAILVVLGGIVAVNVVGVQGGATVDATETQLKMLKQNIEMYQLKMQSLPESLQNLVDGPSDAAKKAKWVAPIIDEVPKDGWGNELKYEVNGNAYEIRSAGLDGQMNSDDDIVVAK